jgi:very-short-patch-repair endonuclease
VERRGTFGASLERILYLSEERKHLLGKLDLALKEAVTYFGITPYLDTANPSHQAAKGEDIQITNSCYFGLFDKSDESLVNDYEEILQKLKEGGGNLASAFQLLIDDFITNNPVSVITEVDDEWDTTGSGDKLVYPSPVPLNEEQRQILAAIGKKDCKYITVEGPPGTGKSHTITAIVCNAILQNQTVLVLSDKKEALDVVEDKITETMNKVRLDKQFQNPLLRLGRAGNTYSKILSTASMERIKEHYRAVKISYPKVESNINTSVTNLKAQIEGTITAYKSITLDAISEFTNLEAEVKTATDLPANLDELHANPLSDNHLATLRNEMLELKGKMLAEDGKLDNLYRAFYPDAQSPKSFRHFITFLTIIHELRITASTALPHLFTISSASTDGIDALQHYVAQCEQLKATWLGYRFKGNKLAALTQHLNSRLPNKFDQPHNHLPHLKLILLLFSHGHQLKAAQELSSVFEFRYDFVGSVHQLLTLNIALPTTEECRALVETLASIESLLQSYPKTSATLGVDRNSFATLLDNRLTRYPDEQFDKLVRYLFLRNDLHHHFEAIPRDDYIGDKEAIEELVTTQMTYKMDNRVVDFFENHRNDARTLAGVISKKQRFDKTSFEKLKKSFPCILAGIRDFAEYIPLDSEIFDLVIIDEASQVSIAQAFPALLRAKKVIVLGDKKQFSNIKSAQARSDTNREYLNRLREVFVDTISDESTKLERLEKFDIKTSILEFFERISNYHIMLKKHFRGYVEIISYSSKYFYSDNLQAIKIRAKPIDQVIRFSFIEHDGRIEAIENSNQPEIEAIVAEVERIAKDEPTNSIGIITPHTNQQKLLVDAFSRHRDSETFQKQHKLKIMTFDTCQGEERDIVLYSMVASPVSDKLWGIFIKDRKSVDLEEGGQIKLQRLNVGFSRAKERMHFFFSKPIEDYAGSIGEAIQHYSRTLEDARKLPDSSSTDQRSPMESKVLHWIQEAPWFKANRQSVEILPQFPLGDYIKQLDKRYTHPAYVVDFLVVYTADDRKEHKIVIEYDGFEFHFVNHGSINEFNHGEYHSEQDEYREKVLESYGYKFLRINRFNVGKDPVATLSHRLDSLVKKKTKVATL